jgi:hypothetical protein
MTPRRLTPWHRLLAVAPVLLIMASMPGQVLLRCRMDGQLRTACCCPPVDAESAPSVPVMAAADCCARETATHQRPAVTLAPADAVLPAPALDVVLLAPPPIARALAHDLRQVQPARAGPPLLLQKQAFLI